VPGNPVQPRRKARNVTEARAKALELAPNEVFCEHDAEYKTGSVVQSKHSGG
jgi:hypothetical protein